MLQGMSYGCVYDRIKHYLVILGIDNGESPHSFRHGCAFVISTLPSVDLMEHIGWQSTPVAMWYSRMQQITDGDSTSALFSAVVGGSMSHQAAQLYHRVNSRAMPQIFPGLDAQSSN